MRAAIDTAMTQIGTREKGNNRGPVEKYLRATRLGPGYPYCLAGIVWSYDVTRGSRPLPFLRTASTWTFWSWVTKHASLTAWHLQPGDVLVWNIPGSVSGHAELVITVHPGGWVRTVGWNTLRPHEKATSGRSVRDGGGVWIHTRSTLHPLSRLRLRGALGLS